MKKYLLVICVYVLMFGSFSLLIATEPWIEYEDISKIKLGSNREGVVFSLGEPMLVLGSSEYDNTLYLFYNYRVKSYNTKHDSIDYKIRRVDKERTTLIKFTFVDDNLISWEEDKMTLSMSTANSGKKYGSLFSYFSLFVNLLLLIKII